MTVIGVVFDFDGVLADSEPLHLSAYQEVFAALGIHLTRDEYYSRYLGYNDEGVFRRMNADHGLQLTDDQIARLIERKSEVFDDVLERTEVLYPAAASCVERLAAEFPLGIASGAMRGEIERILRRSRLDAHIKFVVASGETPESKPSPDPYIRAAQLHGLPPSSCVAIEDSRWGIESAKGAGMQCVAITSTYAAAELTSADAVVASLDEFTSGLIRRLIQSTQ